ncbi:MAG: DedA family protein [Alphaproteobacteria bacterium]|nr:DedA family protein [Alphaproteobacteria bacterium]MDE2109839.1 DedA family protein [Alphaproteobacteria bacterium]MDE2493523.1 DedA family protein [Alphaproteobacteria bacterium]
MVPPDTAVHLLEQYGYLALFIAVAVEGPIMTIIGAFVAGQGYLDIVAVYAVAAAGDLFGDLVYYGVGRLGQRGAPAKVWRIFGLTSERLAHAVRYIERHGAKILLFAKYTQTGFLILPASGAARMPIEKFLWYNTLGTIPKSFALVLIGYYFGYAYKSIDNYFTKVSLLFFGTLCIVGAYFMIRQYLRASYGDR